MTLLTEKVSAYASHVNSLFNSDFEKNEDPDEMLHYAIFHQGLHYLLRQKRSSEKEMLINLETIHDL